MEPDLDKYFILLNQTFALADFLNINIFVGIDMSSKRRCWSSNGKNFQFDFMSNELTFNDQDLWLKYGRTVGEDVVNKDQLFNLARVMRVDEGGSISSSDLGVVADQREVKLEIAANFSGGVHLITDLDSDSEDHSSVHPFSSQQQQSEDDKTTLKVKKQLPKKSASSRRRSERISTLTTQSVEQPTDDPHPIHQLQTAEEQLNVSSEITTQNDERTDHLSNAQLAAIDAPGREVKNADATSRDALAPDIQDTKILIHTEVMENAVENIDDEEVEPCEDEGIETSQPVSKLEKSSKLLNHTNESSRVNLTPNDKPESINPTTDGGPNSIKTCKPQIGRWRTESELANLTRTPKMKKCQICNVTFPTPDDRLKHYQEEHCTCKICGYRSWKAFEMRNHIATKHEGKFPYECKKCGQKFRCTSTRTEHVKRGCADSATRAVRPVRPCVKCKRRFATKEERDLHLRNAHFSCHHCERTFKNGKSLERHIESAHDKLRPHKCPKCPKSFSCPSSRNTHVKMVHQGKRDVVCSTCGRSFYNIGCLNAHVKRHHTKQRDHACTYCSSKFFDASRLKIHIDACHLGIKSISCEDCGKMFARMDSLKQHVNYVHLKLKNFVCKTCERPFGTKAKMQRHEKTHVKDDVVEPQFIAHL